MNIRLVGFLLVAFSGAAVAGNSAHEASRTLAFSTYYEKSEGVVVVVDSFLASQRAAEAFIPLRVLVLVDRLGKNLTVERESFALADSSGQLHCTGGVEAVRRDYGKESFDAGILSHLPLQVGRLTDNRWEVDSRFYPGPAGGLRLDEVELSGFTWLSDVVYFPQPAAGLDGVLTLHFAAEGLASPIAVRFTIPVDRRRRQD